MSRVGLLRHGQVNGVECFRGSMDTVLSQIGTEQMWQTMATDSQWCKVITSPKARCTEFARHYAKKHALAMDVDTALREICFGEWEGQTSADIYAKDPDALSLFWRAPLTNTPPGGESLACFQSRVLSAWQRIASSSAEKNVLVVTHGGVIRIILSHLLQRPVENLLKLAVPYASLHIVNLETQKVTINCCNGKLFKAV
ncbi:MAG: histidine phosphatase family protein [Gammaproteobacteria bacterium]|nr:histidine phosphatase family protein [Gammaproteobacteria bacterium]